MIFKKNTLFVSLLFALFMGLLSACGTINNQTLLKSATDAEAEKYQGVHVVNDQNSDEIYYRIKEGDVIAIRNLQNKNWGGGQSQAALGSSSANVAVTNTVDANSISYIVDRDGMVTLPTLKNKVKISGLTRIEARQKIEDLYRDGGYLVDPIIELNIVNLKVSLFGEFNKQGTFYLTKDNTTLIDILAEAGGLAKTADPRTLKIIRGKNGAETIYVNLSEQQGILGNPKLILQNNDIIIVGASQKIRDEEKVQRFNNIVQPLLVVINLVALIFTLSK